MTPEFFSSSYKQYKNDTSAFTTWLGRAAEACGYKPKPKKQLSESSPEPSSTAPEATAAPRISQDAPPSAARLKGKARKEAKQAQAHVEPEAASSRDGPGPIIKEYGVTTQELLEQIDTVSKSKSKVSMPNGIKKVLERAIAARQRCSDWYESAKPDAAILDSGGHRHFISILQDAFVKLSTEPTAEPKHSKPNASGSKEKDINGLVNRFSYLEVEEIDDNFELSPAEVALATKKTPKKVDSVDVYTLEAEQAFDNAFAVFCFFEDLHRAQESVRTLWKDCISGRTSLVAATVITHAVVIRMRQAEQDLCSRVLRNSSVDDCYQSLAGILFDAASMTKGLNPLDGSRVDITPFDDFIFLPVARILRKYINTAALKHKIQWPAPVAPLRYNYVFQPHKADTPKHKKLEHDDQLLSQLLLDIQLPDQAITAVGDTLPFDMPATELAPAQEDVFLRTLRPVWLKGEMSVTTVVMAQIMLDVIATCGNKLPRFYGQLTHAQKYSSESMDFRISAEGALSTGMVNWPSSALKNLTTLHALLSKIEHPRVPMMKGIIMDVSTAPKTYTWSNTTPEQRKFMGGWDESTRPPPELEGLLDNMKFIRPSPENDFALIHNPLASGSAMLRLLLEYHEAGLVLATHHLSIFVVAHLYNALRQLKMLDSGWPVMDRIIELHKGAIFAGSIPTKTADMADRLSYRLDAYSRQKRSAVVDKYTLRAPAIFKPLRLLLEDGALNQARASFQIEQQIELQEQTSKAHPTPSKSNQTSKQRTTPKSYIASLDKTLTPVLDDLSIDYVRLTKKCIRLMDKFRDMFNIELQRQGDGRNYKPVYEGANSIDIGHVIVCYEVFQEAKVVREQGIYTYRAGDGDDGPVRGFNKDVNDPWRHGLGLLTASKVFKHFLATEDTEFCFPLKVQDVALLEAEAAAAGENSKRYNDRKVHQVSSASELQKKLADSTYAVVDFYVDYARTRTEQVQIFADLARKHAVPSILVFLRANADDMRDLSARYCKEYGQRTIVFFKSGKQVAVNGQPSVLGSNRKALEAAVEKLGNLAQKRLAEQQNSVEQNGS